MLRLVPVWVLVFAGLCLVPSALAQAPFPSPAASVPDGLAQGVQPLQYVEIKSMPPVDVQALLAQDRQRAAEGNPLLRFAFAFDVDYQPESDGTWEELAQDQLVWRLRISSPGARSLNLGFSSYFMPPDGKLYVYDSDYRTVIGPFTAADNEIHHQLWTPIVPGDQIVVELQIPSAQLPELSLKLSSVNHGYTNFGTAGWLVSGSCNLDVVCSAADGYPQVDPWRDEIRSVAVYQRSGVWACTGALVNNTAQDVAPYFLTAYHCGVDALTAPTMVVYWNYENFWCRPPGSAASGEPGDGSLSDYQTGATFLAGFEPSDFTLVELDDEPEEEWNVYWAGWDRSASDPAGAVGIHHPSTKEKRISFEDDPTTTTSYEDTSVPGDGTHIRVTDWDLGTTEPGSSGSPLFNQDRRIVAQLHGGEAACGNDESDWYGRLSVSWNGGGTPNTRLSDWLDPLHSGVWFLDGSDRIDLPFVLRVTPSVLDICAPDPAILSVAVEPRTADFKDPVILDANGLPPGTTLSFDTNPVLPPGTSTMTIGDTGCAPAGAYDVEVWGSAASAEVEARAALSLYTDAPTPPVLAWPADGAENQVRLPTLSWNSVPQAQSYSLEVDRHPLFVSPLIAASAITEPAYALTQPLDRGLCYWWRVQGHNVCGSSEWAGPSHFATAWLAVNFSDSIELGAGKWTHEAAMGEDHWQISTLRSHSPVHAWFVPDDPGVTDSRLSIATPLYVSAGSTLTFWHRYDLEDGYDGAVLEISTDGFAWADLEAYIDSEQGYDGQIDVNYGNPLAGQRAWTGELHEWTEVRVELGSFAGQEVRIRWRLGTDRSLGDVGWYIDDVEVTTPLPLRPAPTLLAVLPNAGSPGSDTPIRIVGTNFVESPSLKLGDTWLPPVTQVSSTLLKAIVPAGLAVGSYDLVLYNGDCQQATLQTAFTATLECIAPRLSVESDSPVAPGQAMHLEAVLLAGTLPLTYTWEFGGAGYGSNLTTATPVFTYTEPGAYTVSVGAEGRCGSATASRSVTVRVPGTSAYLPLIFKSPAP